MLNLILQREVSDSGLVHFYEYSFFDNGFCHGISGIYYVLFKLNELEPNNLLNNKIEYWSNELLKNLNTQLNYKGDIFFPKEKQSTDEKYTIDKESMLNGICGAGLGIIYIKI